LTFLVKAYKADNYYFEVVECFRRLSLASMIGIADPDSAISPVIGLLICLAAVYVFVGSKPYKNPQDSKLGITLAFSLTLFFLAALMLKIAATSSMSIDDQALFGYFLCGVLAAGPMAMSWSVAGAKVLAVGAVGLKVGRVGLKAFLRMLAIRRAFQKEEEEEEEEEKGEEKGEGGVGADAKGKKKKEKEEEQKEDTKEDKTGPKVKDTKTQKEKAHKRGQSSSDNSRGASDSDAWSNDESEEESEEESESESSDDDDDEEDEEDEEGDYGQVHFEQATVDENKFIFRFGRVVGESKGQAVA
jgi:small-conductance mechanosensitive channel